MERVEDSTHSPHRYNAFPTLASFTAEDNSVLAGQYGTYASHFAALESQLQHRMARWATDHLTKLTNKVRRDTHHLHQQAFADLTAVNRSSIDALQVNFLREMTDQITEAMMNEKREFHALVMDTLTKSNHHLKRSSSCLR